MGEEATQGFRVGHHPKLSVQVLRVKCTEVHRVLPFNQVQAGGIRVSRPRRAVGLVPASLPDSVVCHPSKPNSTEKAEILCKTRV